ncbi:MAG: carbamoyl-phosphate synthase (glutamine-hydrolyzing) large subunit, partial [Rectinemataceae bacterium]
VRDYAGNCVTVCNMENFDPLGIHTGESIVVAPSQTLDDHEYQMLRQAAIRVVSHLGIVGECNIQFALDPASDRYRVIEVNARLSRSSALASKATGYPLAFVAAKLALGASLTEVANRITRTTTACFEPALDYVVVKMPCWDFAKFRGAERTIGSEMKSVGEVMAIGRCFEEALQKAIRMLGLGVEGLTADKKVLGDGFRTLAQALSRPTDRRIFAVYAALLQGWSVRRIARLTHIDAWFLGKLENIARCQESMERHAGQASNAGSALSMPSPELLRKAKKLGFSDAAIAGIYGLEEKAIRRMRQSMGILPAVKQIDTLAAEFPAQTNYLYMTYGGSSDDVAPLRSGILVLGSGPYRIGSSVEFDWCCVRAVTTLRNLGKHTIMINCNPATVSTDYDVCDRLYFDELSHERVLDIYERECPDGLLLSMGGQIANNLAGALYDDGVVVLGTSPLDIDRAEDRQSFSALLDRLGIEQPPWMQASDLESVRRFAREVGYPVLVRPSYVLSGAAMQVVWDDASLQRYLDKAAAISRDKPVVVSKFLEGAKEIEIDFVAAHGTMLYYAISEHVENAGVHSGDATVVLPAQRVYLETLRQIRSIAAKIASALNITGPCNIQFLAIDNKVKVIECNLRASRSFPFSSKVGGVDMIDLAVRAMTGAELPAIPPSAMEVAWVGVKAAQFSFSRLAGVDPVPGVEMASTGEVGCIGSDVHDALLKALLSVGHRIPGRRILLSTGPLEDKLDFLESARALVEMGYEFVASRGTARFLASAGIPVQLLHWPLERREPNIATELRRRSIDLVINIPKNNRELELRNDYLIRRLAVDLDIPLITDIKLARAFAEALRRYRQRGIEIKSLQEYRSAAIP